MISLLQEEEIKYKKRRENPLIQAVFAPENNIFTESLFTPAVIKKREAAGIKKNNKNIPLYPSLRTLEAVRGSL